MSGWSELGALLAGGARDDYARGQYKGNQLELAMMKAGQAREEAMARRSFAQRAYDEGKPELADFFLAGGNPEQLSGYQLDQQKIGFGDSAMDLARAPNTDIGELNEMLMVMGGKPYAPTRVQGNTILSTIDPNIAPQTTELGQAMIGTQNAHAGAYGAQANASNALAEKRRADGGAGGGMSVKPSGLTSTEIEAMFSQPVTDEYGNVTNRVDPNAYREFLAFMQRMSASDPRFRNAQFAAQAWANRAGTMPDETLPGTLDLTPQAATPQAGSLVDLITGQPDQASSQYADDAPTLTPEQAAALPQGALFRTTDGRLLRKQ